MIEVFDIDMVEYLVLLIASSKRSDTIKIFVAIYLKISKFPLQ